jgi:hypothetical protein
VSFQHRHVFAEGVKGEGINIGNAHTLEPDEAIDLAELLADEAQRICTCDTDPCQHDVVAEAITVARGDWRAKHGEGS